MPLHAVGSSSSVHLKLATWPQNKLTFLCVNMDFMKLEHQSVIKFLTKEVQEPKVIHEQMLAVYGDAAPSEYQIKYWSK